MWICLNILKNNNTMHMRYKTNSNIPILKDLSMIHKAIKASKKLNHTFFLSELDVNNY
jgi:hypothetical protein